MANDCSWWFRACSRDPHKLAKFIKAWNVEYYEEGPHLFRIWDPYENVEMHQIGSSGIFSVEMSGTCAWSLACCIKSGGSSYYSSCINEKHEEVKPYYRNARCINDLCRECETAIDIFSEESGNAFAEHITVNANGDYLVDDVCDYYEYWRDEDEYPTIGEFNEAHGTTFTEDDFEDGYVRVGGYADESFYDEDWLLSDFTKEPLCHRVLLEYDKVADVGAYKKFEHYNYDPQAMKAFREDMKRDGKDIRERRQQAKTIYEKEEEAYISKQKKLRVRLEQEARERAKAGRKEK